MILEIISPSEDIYSGTVHLVQFPGTLGSFEVMNNHAPLISTLEKGKIKVITDKGDVKYFDTDGGVVEVKDNKIMVLNSEL